MLCCGGMGDRISWILFWVIVFWLLFFCLLCLVCGLVLGYIFVVGDDRYVCGLVCEDLFGDLGSIM